MLRKISGRTEGMIAAGARKTLAALWAASAAVSLPSCTERPSAPAAASQPEPAPGAAPRAGHKNAEYSIAGRAVRLVDGVATTPAAPGSAATSVTRYFSNEVWTDLNADGREDVVFLLTQEPGGSGTFYYAVAALDLPGGFAGSEAMLLGDRIAPQATALGPNGLVVVSYAERAPGDGFATAPSIAKSIRIKVDPATLRLGEVAQDFAGEADPAVMKLDMKTWLWLRAVYDDGRELAPRQAEAFTLTFAADGTFSATTDCNRVRGGYSVNARELTFGNMAATKMFCADSQESVFTELLGNVASYSFTARGELVLALRPGGSVLFR
jgi:heat shock protein HslJ